MTGFEIIAQTIGIAAMVFNISSYQCKKSGGVIACQLFGSTLFAVSFFMLGATVGGLMNLIGALRAIVYMNRKPMRADSAVWLGAFVAMYAVSYVLTFTVFGKELTALNALIELLPLIAMTATTVGFRRDDAAVIRKCGLISSPCWLVYNITNLALGAVICEVLSLVSIVTAYIRLDRKK